MPAGSLDLTIEQGATYEKKFIWKDANSVLIPLTGYVARMQVRAVLADAEFLIELTTENGGIALGGANGEIDLLISATDTAAITWFTGVYDLELQDGSGKVTRLLEGKVKVKAEVTR